MSASAGRFRVGAYEVLADAGELLRDGRGVPIQRQPFELLVCLLERPGRVHTREELYARLWPTGTFVDFEHGLNTAVRKLRRALRDTPEAPRYVETVPGRGYRFIARVEPLPGATPEVVGSPSPDRTALLDRPPFVDREPELGRLELHLRRARDGRGGLALVAGEPGVGKTRLLEEVMESARRADCRVLAGRCVQGEGVTPYGAFAEAL